MSVNICECEKEQRATKQHTAGLIIEHFTSHMCTSNRLFFLLSSTCSDPIVHAFFRSFSISVDALSIHIISEFISVDAFTVVRFTFVERFYFSFFSNCCSFPKNLLSASLSLFLSAHSILCLPSQYSTSFELGTQTQFRFYPSPDYRYKWTEEKIYGKTVSTFKRRHQNLSVPLWSFNAHCAVSIEIMNVFDASR